MNILSNCGHLSDNDLYTLLKRVSEEIERRKKPKDPLERKRVADGKGYYYIDAAGQVYATTDNLDPYQLIGGNALFNSFNYYPCDEYTQEEVKKMALQQKAFRKLQFAAKRLNESLAVKQNTYAIWIECYDETTGAMNVYKEFLTEEERKAFEV